MAETTAPSTPARSSSLSSSSPPKSSASTAATSTEKPKRSTEEMDIDQDQDIEQSSEVEIIDSPQPATATDDKVGDKKDQTTAKKRKATTTSKSVVANKKAKSSSTTTTKKPSSTSNAKASGSKEPTTKESGEGINVSNEVVAFKNGKLEHKQTSKVNADKLSNYLIGRAAFIEWAVEHFKTAGDSVDLQDVPAEHLGAIAKDVQDSSSTLLVLARSIRASLAASIGENLSAVEDSQEGKEDEEDIKAKMIERIDLDSVKRVIESLAERTNYGLDSDDLSEGLPEGVSSIPNSLQYWVWEVKDLSLLSPDLVPKYERRRVERQEIKRSTIELYLSLSSEQQVSLLLSKKGTSSSTPSTTTKGKGKSKAMDVDEETEGEGTVTGKGKKTKSAKGKEKARDDGEEADGEGEREDEKKRTDSPSATTTVKEKKKTVKKVKELTEEEKAEKEEKARIKAEKEAEKEEKRKEKEAKKALKAEKDAADEEKKALKRKEKEEKQLAEEKKQAALKSQKSLMSSFFVKTSPTPGSDKPGPSSASPVATASTLKQAVQSSGDFAKVFHPFTVRPGVEVAPTNRFAKKNGKNVEVKVDSDPSLTLKESLASFVSSASKRRIPPYNPYPSPAVSVRQAVVAINDSTLTSTDASEYYALLKDREKVPVKLLKFREDVRPGYIGTWSKTSKVVTPRTPFGRDGGVLNYEIDSENEWEEEVDDPEAENVDSGGEMSDDGDDPASDADSWLAGDDEIEYEEGYESDGDIVMLDAEGKPRRNVKDEDDDDDIIVVEGEKEKKERIKKERERKRKAEEKAKKRKAAGPLLPVIKGPAWENREGKSTEPAFRSMKIQFLNDFSFGLDPFTFVSKPPFVPQPAPTTTVLPAASASKGKENVAIASPVTAASSPASTSADKDKKPNRPASKPFPDYLIPKFIQEAQGSDRSQAVIIDEFVRKMKEDSVTVTKNSCVAKWKELGFKKTKGKTVVPNDVLTRHGVSVA